MKRSRSASISTPCDGPMRRRIPSGRSNSIHCVWASGAAIGVCSISTNAASATGACRRWRVPTIPRRLLRSVALRRRVRVTCETPWVSTKPIASSHSGCGIRSPFFFYRRQRSKCSATSSSVNVDSMRAFMMPPIVGFHRRHPSQPAVNRSTLAGTARCLGCSPCAPHWPGPRSRQPSRVPFG